MEMHVILIPHVLGVICGGYVSHAWISYFESHVVFPPTLFIHYFLFNDGCFGGSAKH